MAGQPSDNTLADRRCRPCEGGVVPLGAAAVDELCQRLDAGWHPDADGRAICREFRFDTYARTIGFVNAVAWIAESQDHHPDLEVTYGRVVVRWSTHAIGGLSENDFICAAQVDRL